MNIGAFISLRFFVDCTLSEISKIVGMRESAVKKRLYRALEKLRSELKELLVKIRLQSKFIILLFLLFKN
ncbi:RNA polymerase sigma factor [Paenibacillus odorifer]|uniref:RNA polymerase sigma factor n=2 Tax=Paenibacillus TaxID=44249 RepID=UPI00096CE102|nr:sigma factor-like helix-turn-helix DNA-binding protein [Paenibacillus odorifer]